MMYIESHPDNPWDWHGISRNPNLTIEYVEAHPEKQWYWPDISRNPNIFKPLLPMKELDFWDSIKDYKHIPRDMLSEVDTTINQLSKWLHRLGPSWQYDVLQPREFRVRDTFHMMLDKNEQWSGMYVDDDAKDGWKKYIKNASEM